MPRGNASTGERLATIEAYNSALQTQLNAIHTDMKERFDKLDHDLFGNGQPGLVKDLQGADEANAKRIRKQDRRLMLVAVMAILSGVVTGVGSASLKSAVALLWKLFQ